MNPVMFFLEILLLGCGVVFLTTDPTNTTITNTLLITVLIAILIHIAINVLFICRGKWFCTNCS